MKEIALISAQDAGSNLTSVPALLGDRTSFSIHADFSGSDLGGTLELQSSNDEVDWIQVEGSDQTVSSAASHMWNVSGASYKFVRVNWTYSSGSGNLDCKMVIKE